ncbi:unnamed protein product [Adineta steineri]|uniref:Transporter n=1 Tax=Adineta steineri TaxID=433720 RepID=A0A815KCE2_9BILA|nr:unnamed protein product [Adineta steineri]CAF3826392.1 unnamed protein product [Adineta steineri]
MLNNLVARFRRQNHVVEPTKTDLDTIATSEEDKDSHEWDRPLEFIFSLISNSVGLGNVWRFPYLAAKSGGGAFLIPYFILYFLIGAPIYYLELALGQFSSRGPATAFILAKGWQGVGFAMIINSVLCMLYYNVIISWALFYFVSSFRTNLLWKKCGYWWNDNVKCFVPGSGGSPYVSNNTMYNCTESEYQNQTDYGCVEIKFTDRSTATEQFFYKLLLGKSERFEDFGTPQLYSTLALLASWIIVGLCIIRGVKSSGKVAYFTAIFPYIVLLILIIQSATLTGAVDGIKYYIIPNWDLVAKFETWQAAASQVFFSLGLSFGSLMAYSSSNKFNNNFFRQMCIVVSCDCFTGIFAGFAVFSTIGFLAAESKETVAKYAESSGPGLAFITYPEAISHMPASSFFSILFFLMLLALGLGSQFALTDVPITSIIELFPRFRSKRPHAVVITCVVSFLISLPFTCPGGIYLFELLMEYAANVSMVVVGFFEVYTIAYIYGFNRFMNDVKMMLGKRAAQYYLFLTWCIISPILMFVIILSKLLTAEPMKNNEGAGFEAYEYPQWSTILGWLIFVGCIIPIPIVYIYNYIKEYKNIGLKQIANPIGVGNGNELVEDNDYMKQPRYLEALTQNNSPRDDWGPKKRVNQYGLYAHLRKIEINNTNNEIRLPSTIEFPNRSFHPSEIDNNDSRF